jgi:TolB protein
MAPTAPVLFRIVSLLLALAGPAAAQELRPVYTELADLGVKAGGPVESPRGRFILFRVFTGRGRGDELRIFDRASSKSFGLGFDATDVVWSPRGDRLVFARLDEAERALRVWTAPMDPRTGRPAGPPRRISVRQGRGPTFSPDGRWVAFTTLPATDSIAPRIVVIPAAGGAERVLVRAPGFAQQLRWSPDGRWIYYRARPQGWKAGDPLALYRVSARGGDPELLRKVQDFLGLSADGRFLAYFPPGAFRGKRSILAVATADGVEVGRITLPHQLQAISWAGSGAKILAIRNNDPISIHVASFSGGPVRPITSGRNLDLSPAWSPDGRRLAFASLLNSRYQLMVADVRGGPRRQVPTDEEPDGTAPLWSPDGRYLAFLSENRRVLNVVELASGVEAKLASAERIEELTWKRNGRALLYVRAEGGESEVREVALGGHETVLRPLTGELADHGSLTFVGDSMLIIPSRKGVFAAPIRGNGHRTLYTPAARDEVQYTYMKIGIDVSRDGRWAAVPVLIPAAGGATQDAIRLVALDGSPGRTLPIGYLSYVSRFTWHPDGRHLLVMGQREANVRMDVFLVPLGGEPLRPLTAGDPSAGLFGFQVSPDGSAFAFAASGSAPAALWEIDLTRALAGYTAAAKGRPTQRSRR